MLEIRKYILDPFWILVTFSSLSFCLEYCLKKIPAIFTMNFFDSQKYPKIILRCLEVNKMTFNWVKWESNKFLVRKRKFNYLAKAALTHYVTWQIDSVKDTDVRQLQPQCIGHDH